jgi:hypothetical protein
MTHQNPSKTVDEHRSRPKLWDGKAWREVWHPEDGDGDPNHSMLNIRIRSESGHPTWKLFTDDVPFPIIRGQQEPPKFVYLDDKACYDIHTSAVYSREELAQFWPVDFTAQGFLRVKRPNRGRPALVGGAIAVSTGAKGELYSFRGGKSKEQVEKMLWKTRVLPAGAPPRGRVAPAPENIRELARLERDKNKSPLDVTVNKRITKLDGQVLEETENAVSKDELDYTFSTTKLQKPQESDAAEQRVGLLASAIGISKIQPSFHYTSMNVDADKSDNGAVLDMTINAFPGGLAQHASLLISVVVYLSAWLSLTYI